LSQKVRKLFSEQTQPEGVLEQAAPQVIGVPRRVRVKGMQGIDATVVVTVVQGNVWLSVSPPFTWEAIMEPGKVDELMHVLELAQEEAKEMAVHSDRPTSQAGKAIVRAITTGGSATQ
jgi:hypothetical protein